MLVLDFINVGNGDSILVREMEGAWPRSVPLIAEAHSGKSWLECH